MDSVKHIQLHEVIVATDMSYEDFLHTDFGEKRVEWVNGVIIDMGSISKIHNAITRFLIAFFEDFLSLTTGGEVFHDPMVMHSRPDLPGRAPDVQIVLPENAHIIGENDVAGPADLVVEVVSPESIQRDHVDKRREYQKGGVKEYWVIDPLDRETIFYQRNAHGIFETIQPDEQGIYHSKVLTGLSIPADLFWRDTLPRGAEITEMVADMLKAK
jgi:Uma2 family endonuclease